MKTVCVQFFDTIKNGGRTLRRRFILYATSAIIATVMLLFLILSLFGVIDPADSRIKAYLNDQLDNHIAQTEHDFDKLAACTVAFSNQMTEVINSHLDNSGLSFEDLENNIDALTALQEKSYSTVYTNIRVAPCSGAFYILNTSVNVNSAKPLYNGVYIKFANLYADNNVNTKVSLFRGASDIARHNGINLSSTWQNEMCTDAFLDMNTFDDKVFIISKVTKIPDTWEKARYIYSPIYGNDGNIIGICGYELSNLYTQLAYSTADTESAQTICAILDRSGNGYTGQFISNRSGYMPPKCDAITVKEHGSLFEYECDGYSYIGKEKQTIIGNNLLTVAIMFPKNQYKKIVFYGRAKNIAIFFFISVAALCISLLLSKKYISPIRKSISQFKEKKRDYIPSGVSEIDDLFSFLAEQDRRNEEAIAEMENKNAQMQLSLEKLNSEVKREIARLAHSRKSELDSDSYNQFLEGVKTLTQTERAVFDYYLEGKKVKEIVELLGIKETTVRFHNRNIYSKLGVNSLKQLLLYATIMKSDETE